MAQTHRTQRLKLATADWPPFSITPRQQRNPASGLGSPCGLAIMLMLFCAVMPDTAHALATIYLTENSGARMRPFGVYGESRSQVLIQSVPGSFESKLTLPPQGLLRTAITVPRRTWTADLSDKVRPTRFSVRWLTDSGSATLFDRVLDVRNGRDQRWHEVAVDLSAYAGEAGVISFTARATDGSSGFVALWDQPAVISLAPPLPPNLLLIVLDALRPDHLSTYGYKRRTSRHLDRLSADSILFLNAFSSAPKTIPSVPQLLRSSYFPDQVATTSLLKLVKQWSFPFSRAIVNNPYVTAWLQQQEPELEVLMSGDFSARAISRRALTWLRATSGEPFFLFLHYLDTHTPYDLPAVFAGSYVEDDYQGNIGLSFEDVTGTWQGKYKGRDQRRITNLYDGTIRYADHHIGRLLEGLKQLGIYDQTLIVVTADHGEELWEHGRFFHGQSLYDELLHVPLIVKLPGQKLAGTRVGSLASLVDVVPTLAGVVAETLGRAGPEAAWDGRSLLPLTSAEAAGSRSLFATVSRAEPNAPPRHALRGTRYKYIVTATTGREQLFDLAADPGERENLAQKQPGIVERMRRELNQVVAPLARTGYQIEIYNQAASPVDYLIRLQTDPPAPLVEISRVALETGDTFAVGRHSSGVNIQGKLPPGDRDGVRFDILGTTGKCGLMAFVNRRPIPTKDVLFGNQGRHPEQIPVSVPLSAPYLTAAPRLTEAGEGGEVKLLFWRKAGQGTHTAPAPMSQEMRERLRTLGYAQ